MAALTVALAPFSYFEIKSSLPSLTTPILTHRGQTAPVGQVIGHGLYIDFFLQLFLSAAFLCVAYVAPENIHLGWWCFSSYTPEQRDRILPLLRELMALLAFLFASYFASCIYLQIHQARSPAPSLAADWVHDAVRTQLEGLAALAAVSGLIIYAYVGRFDEIAGER